MNKKNEHTFKLKNEFITNTMVKLELEKDWPEILFVLFFAISFFIFLVMRQPFFSYLTVFLSGGFASHIFYLKRYREPILPFVLIIIGFLLGYILGGFWVSRFLTLFFFGLGYGFSWYFHKNKIFGSFKSEMFLK